MISFRILIVTLVVWTAASPAWLADGSRIRNKWNRIWGTRETHLAPDPQFQKEIAPTRSPSSLGASPLRNLPAHLFYAVPLLHPWPNELAAVSGQFRDNVDSSRDRGRIIRALQPASGIDSYQHFEDLVKKQIKSLGKYRLTDYQIRILLSIARNSFLEHVRFPTEETKATIPYIVGVVNDLIRQPNFAAIIKAIYANYAIEGRPTYNTPVGAYLMFRQADLATKIIAAGQLPITRPVFGCAMGSESLEVVDTLCKFAEAHPELVAFDDSIVRTYASWIDTEKHMVPNFWPVVSEKDFLAAVQHCLNAVKLKQER